MSSANTGQAAPVIPSHAWVADLADAKVFGVRGEPGFALNADGRVEAVRVLGRG